MARKLDIFDLLGAIDKKDQDFYDRLEVDARKEFAPPVALRWASAIDDGPQSDRMLLFVNERANINYWDISDHPELQYRLLASCGSGKKHRHQWIANKAKNKNDKIRNFVGQFYPSASLAEIDMLIGKFTKASFQEFVDVSGLEPKEAKEMVKAYDQYISAKDPSQASKKRKAG